MMTKNGATDPVFSYIFASCPVCGGNVLLSPDGVTCGMLTCREQMPLLFRNKLDYLESRNLEDNCWGLLDTLEYLDFTQITDDITSLEVLGHIAALKIELTDE